MKYIRKTSHEITSNYAMELLIDRGILNRDDEVGSTEFFNPSADNFCDPMTLDHMQEAMDTFMRHLENGSHIRIYVDCDVDGFTSAALLVNYMNDVLLPYYPNVKISYHIPEGKEHGLKTVMYELENEKICDLIILPDSSSNDYDEHKTLSDMGYDILVLDHHNAEKYSENAIIVNNQLSNYPNKMASGVGIVFKFLQALETSQDWPQKSTDYIDLVALGEVSDMMHMYNAENRYICDYGLSHINNKLFQAIVKKQCYSMFGITEDKWSDDYYYNGEVTQVKVAFYVTPLINALIRVGTQQEKELMFESFINGGEIVKSTKRGAGPNDTETIAEQSTRNCVNGRSRQNREKEKAIELLDIQIMNDCLDQNKVIILNADELNVPTTLTGLIAMGIAAKYKKPTLLGRTSPDGYLKGSIRGCEESELKDFQKFLQDSRYMDFVEGHPNAAGFSIKVSNLDKLCDYANKELADINFNEGFYEADFVVPANYSDIENLVWSIGTIARVWGQGNKEPIIVVENLHVPKSAIQVIGTKKNTIKIEFNNMTYMIFQATDLIEKIKNYEKNELTINIVGTANINKYYGKETPQINVQEIEIKESSIYDF